MVILTLISLYLIRVGYIVRRLCYVSCLLCLFMCLALIKCLFVLLVCGCLCLVFVETCGWRLFMMWPVAYVSIVVVREPGIDD